MINGNLAYKIKGTISFPCCSKEKIVVYEGGSGQSSLKCPNCNKYAIFDYDSMESMPSKVLRGVTQKYR